MCLCTRPSARLGRVSKEKAKVDLSVVQVVASALAAVSSAVLLSTVGVAGTLIGAAVGSVIATVAGAVYTYSLQASRERVAAAAQVAAMARANLTRRGETGMQVAPHVTAEPDGEPPEPDRPAWRTALTGLSWKRVAAFAAGVFLAAMAAIVAFELVAGEPISRYTGGTSSDSSRRTTLGGGSGEKSEQQPSSEGSESPGSDATTDSTDEATPSESPGELPGESPGEDTGEEATPSAEPTVDQTPTEEPAEPAVPTNPATPEG